MTVQYDLNRFVKAQAGTYNYALNEVRAGRKQSHWMWFIFPQIAGLGYSETSKFYAIKDITEAGMFLQHEVLGPRLLEISRAVLEVNGKSAARIFGSPDDAKLKSCMTLFAGISGADPVFESILKKYFHGEKDVKTMQILGRQQ